MPRRYHASSRCRSNKTHASAGDLPVGSPTRRRSRTVPLDAEEISSRPSDAQSHSLRSQSPLRTDSQSSSSSASGRQKPCKKPRRPAQPPNGGVVTRKLHANAPGLPAPLAALLGAMRQMANGVGVVPASQRAAVDAEATRAGGSVVWPLRELAYCLRKLCAWAEGTYWPWFQKEALGMDGSPGVDT